MAGLVPAIHVFIPLHMSKTWMPGTRPGMTRSEYVHPCRPSFSAAVQVRQLSCGIWIWVEPRNPKASLIAFEKHGTPPTFGLSPTPLAPIGWCGDGVVVQSVSQCGVSTAVGRK